MTRSTEPPPFAGQGEPTGPSCSSEREEERHQLVERYIRREGIDDPRVLRAMRCVPRHRFVPKALSTVAYEDRPLPIGFGQTISQPFIVAAMSAAAKPERTDRCLEIGTGSGYQAAVLAELCQVTYSIEYLPEVAQVGEANLRGAGYGPDRVKLRVGDGYQGWTEAAPFQVILVTAAPQTVPRPLLDQLAVGGRLVIPVGSQSVTQDLELWLRKPDVGKEPVYSHQDLMGVRFVPMRGRSEAE